MNKMLKYKIHKSRYTNGWLGYKSIFVIMKEVQIKIMESLRMAKCF